MLAFFQMFCFAEAFILFTTASPSKSPAYLAFQSLRSQTVPQSKPSHLFFISCVSTTKWNQSRIQAVCFVLVCKPAHFEPSGTKLGSKLFALHFLQVNTFGTKWNQVEPRPEPSQFTIVSRDFGSHTPTSNYITI